VKYIGGSRASKFKLIGRLGKWERGKHWMGRSSLARLPGHHQPNPKLLGLDLGHATCTGICSTSQSCVNNNTHL
jgi:hypothetical protein